MGSHPALRESEIEARDSETSKKLELNYRLDAGASVRLKGRIVSSKGSGQSKELLVESTEIIGTCDPEVCPFCPFTSSLP